MQEGKGGKGMGESIHFQNLQLYGYGMLFNACGIWLKGDLVPVMEQGFFFGYNAWTWAAVLNMSFIGLVISAIMKYSNVMMKVMASSMAMIASTVVAQVFFHFEVTKEFMAGVGCISAAIYLYTIAPPAKAQAV